jgi:hypothetical protein
LTRAPSPSARTELNGPTTTLSPSFNPESTSKYFFAGDPGLDRLELCLVVADHEDAFDFLALLPGLSSAA